MEGGTLGGPAGRSPPRASMDSQRAPAPYREVSAAPPPPVARRRRRACILVVDDGASARESNAAALRRAGFDVQVAADGLEGLARTVARRPDAVVIEVSVPVMDGWEL